MNAKEMHEAMSLILESDIDLKTDGLWSLRQDVAEDIEKAFGPIECGWSEFIGLAAGTNLIEAESDRFVRTLESLPGEGEFKGLMFKAYSEKMCPPSAAVSLFIVMGASPYAGLLCAHHKSGKLEKVPVEIVYLSDITNKAISSLAEVVRDRKEGVVRDIAEPFGEAIRQLRLDLTDEMEEEIFFTPVLPARNIEPHIESIMRLWMIPAGIVSLNNGVFAVLED